MRIPYKATAHAILKTLFSCSLSPSFIGFLLLGQLHAQQTSPSMPMQARYEDGAEFRWLHKQVLDSRLLDDMHDLSAWSFAGAGEMTLVQVDASEPWTAAGQAASDHVMRLRSTTGIAQVDGSGEWEDLVATRTFAGENWGKFNRI